MNNAPVLPKIVDVAQGVTLVAAGPARRADFLKAQALAPILVAADGGARHLARWGALPRAVIGDLDSLPARLRATLPPATLHPIAEQDSTDFDKALRHIAAPFVIALGVLGGRADHLLAALSTLAKPGLPPALLLGAEDVLFAAPPGRDLTLDLPPGTRLSLYPLAPQSGQAKGLRWGIDGLRLDPVGRIGTSNQVQSPKVLLRFDAPGMMVLLPARHLGAALTALRPAEGRGAAPPFG